MRFDNEQEEAGVNKYGHYQFGANACVGCRTDRPLKEPGMWCDACKNHRIKGEG